MTELPSSNTTPVEPPTGRRFGVAALAVVLVIGLGAGLLITPMFSGRQAGEPETADTDAPKLPPGVVEVDETAQRSAAVEMAAVISQTLPTVIEVTGLVAPEESRVAHIRPLARGLIEGVSVSLGSRVEAGQPLMTFDNIELGELIGTYLSEKSALQQTESELNVKRQMWERAQELIKLEAIAQQTLELRRAEMQNAEAGVTSQRARVAKVEEQIHRFGLTDPDLAKLTTEEGRNVHRTASHSVIRAPFAGVITSYDVAKGEVVQPDKELFTLTNLTTVWVQADVYEKDLGQIQRDSDVVVKVEAYPGRTFAGRLTFIADLIDPKTRTAKVRCVVSNDDAALKLDMFARIAIPTRNRRETLVVPQAAVQQVDNLPVVFVRRTATQFERRDVRVGASAGDLVEVLDGLKAGETVVAAGSFYFKTALLRERIGGE